MKSIGVFLLLIALAGSLPADEPKRKAIWEGQLHLGDSAVQYAALPSAGMMMQVPCAIDAAKQGGLMITTRDIQTLAGDGHYAELMAHYEDGDGPAREYVVQTFRLKCDDSKADVDHRFSLEPMKGLYQKPAYYSVRIKVDTQIKFGLWDDFVLMRIEIEQ